jgi:Flp pilus assembly protein TadG
VNKHAQNKRPRKRQNGATLPLVVLALTALLGVAALAIDLNVMEQARQRAQNVADAAALAAVQNPSTAGAVAASIVAANSSGGTLLGASTIVNADNSVTVSGYVNAPLSFAPTIGYAPHSLGGAANTLSVSASATAALPNVCGLPLGMPVAPFGMIGDDPSNTDPAVAYIASVLNGTKALTPGAYQPVSSQLAIKLNVWDNTGRLASPGSFDPLLTSGGTATYFDTIQRASDQALSAGQGLTTPPLGFDNVGLTRQYLAARLSLSNTAYSHSYTTYDTWFNAGSPLLPDGVHPEDHLLMLPVISQAVKNKQGAVTIIAFAIFFVDQPYPVSSPLNAVALGRFLGLTVPGGVSGACSGAGGKTLPALSH